eukprot:1867278-Amphidinium_carterae.1
MGNQYMQVGMCRCGLFKFSVLCDLLVAPATPEAAILVLFSAICQTSHPRTGSETEDVEEEQPGYCPSVGITLGIG